MWRTVWRRVRAGPLGVRCGAGLDARRGVRRDWQARVSPEACADPCVDDERDDDARWLRVGDDDVRDDVCAEDERDGDVRADGERDDDVRWPREDAEVSLSGLGVGRDALRPADGRCDWGSSDGIRPRYSVPQGFGNADGPVGSVAPARMACVGVAEPHVTAVGGRPFDRAVRWPRPRGLLASGRLK